MSLCASEVEWERQGYLKPFSSLLLFGTGTDSIHGVVGSIPVEEFYDASGNVPGASEIITGIQVPQPPGEEKTTFIKFRVRDAIDFAIVSVASAFTLSKGRCRHVRIFLGAMAPVPLRAIRAEAFLEGKKITREIAGEAASLALEGSKSLSMNAYKIQIAKKLMIRSILPPVSLKKGFFDRVVPAVIALWIGKKS